MRGLSYLPIKISTTIELNITSFNFSSVSFMLVGWINLWQFEPIIASRNFFFRSHLNTGGRVSLWPFNEIWKLLQSLMKIKWNINVERKIVNHELSPMTLPKRIGHCYAFKFNCDQSSQISSFVLILQEMSMDNGFKMLLDKLDWIFLQDNN